MSIRVDIQRTDFYNELSIERQKEYFDCKWHKFLPGIDNIYYGLYVVGDHKNNANFNSMLEELEYFKRAAIETHQLQEYFDGLCVDWRSFKIYKYCLTHPDLYDIYVLSYLPNRNTPRIHVQLRSYGLWTHGAEKMLEDSYNHVVKLLAEFTSSEVEKCMENRIDYCYHTNAIQRPEIIFKDNQLEKYFYGTMSSGKKAFRINCADGRTKIMHDYCAFGNRSSNYVYVRFYNKGLEVIEEGYKQFFFEIWRQKGLISFYDEYCLRKAYLERNFDYIHKARLEFYLEYGTDDRVRREFELTLEDKNLTYRQVKELADAYMPDITTIFNAEFETKRKFYDPSDEFIDAILKTLPTRKSAPEPMKRIYRIIDNRKVFLEYLTSTTVSFRRKRKTKKEEVKYVAWWERLRNTKLEGNAIDEKLVRDYSSLLDRDLVQRRFINSVGTNAVYDGNVESCFMDDLSAVLSNINDNDAHRANIRFESLDGFDSKLLRDYEDKKRDKYKRVKNRLNDNQGDETQNPAPAAAAAECVTD